VGAPLVSLSDIAVAMQTVTDGRGAMPSFKASLAADQITDVSAYVVQTFAAR
jgi:mono/diheme cytochrome c family protein